MLPSAEVRGRKNPFHFGFAARLSRDARKAGGLSRFGVTTKSAAKDRELVASLEQGQRIPRLDTVERVAYALGLSPARRAYGILADASQPIDGWCCEGQVRASPTSGDSHPSRAVGACARHGCWVEPYRRRQRRTGHYAHPRDCRSARDSPRCFSRMARVRTRADGATRAATCGSVTSAKPRLDRSTVGKSPTSIRCEQRRHAAANTASAANISSQARQLIAAPSPA